MKPTDFYLRRLDVIIGLRQDLAVLASRLPWQTIEADISHRFAYAAQRGEKQVCITDLFREEIVLASKRWNAGRPRLPNEFGFKVGIAANLNRNLIVGARSFATNPYGGHMLAEQLEQAMILMQEHNVKIKTTCVDVGYRGVDADTPLAEICHRGKGKRLTDEERHRLKRRQPVEPIIGHLKSNHQMQL